MTSKKKIDWSTLRDVPEAYSSVVEESLHNDSAGQEVEGSVKKPRKGAKASKNVAYYPPMNCDGVAELFRKFYSYPAVMMVAIDSYRELKMNFGRDRDINLTANYYTRYGITKMQIRTAKQVMESNPDWFIVVPSSIGKSGRNTSAKVRITKGAFRLLDAAFTPNPNTRYL